MSYSRDQQLILNDIYQSQSGYEITVPAANVYSLDDDSEEEEQKKVNWLDSCSDTMDREEAQEAMEDVCVSTIQGTKYDIDYVTRRRLATWIMFNPSLFGLYEKEQMTRDVNYTEF